VLVSVARVLVRITCVGECNICLGECDMCVCEYNMCW
jgi:hypothetical protein